MKILAIETSCDETALALIEIEDKKTSWNIKVLGEAVLSQAQTHAPLGGVVPNLARREHEKNLLPLLNSLAYATEKESVGTVSTDTRKDLRKILERESYLLSSIIETPPQKPEGLGFIAVTCGPGLEPALWVGINFAKALSSIWKVPVMPINHMEGHVVSSLLRSKGDKNYTLNAPALPMLTLLISGGHTELVLTKDLNSYELLGETQDDAIGEAYDKVARMLGLPYPGGPEISRLAEEARAGASIQKINLPRPMLKTADLNFSFAGLKTSVLYTLKKFQEITPEIKRGIALEFENSVTEVLLAKTIKAIEQTGAKTLSLGGGVAANLNIRKVLQTEIDKQFPEVKMYLPGRKLTTDNALMIAVVAGMKEPKIFDSDITARGNLRLA